MSEEDKYTFPKRYRTCPGSDPTPYTVPKHFWKRKQECGAVLLSDIHPHWHYNRPESDVPLQLGTIPRPFLLLNPLKVKGKGRPKGALGGGSRVALSSTRRDPSFFELPSSSAPASLGQAVTVETSLSSTAIAMRRIEHGHRDLYEPGTRRERAYMQGISSISPIVLQMLLKLLYLRCNET